MIATFTEKILAFLDRRELEPCPISDSTGLYICNQPAVVFDREIEAAMCMCCYKERP
jgi:hypothetical protein